MNEARDENCFQPRQFWKLMQTLVALVFAAILCVVLFKIIMLSKDMEDSRRMLKELSSNLLKTQRENDDLRQALRHTRTKMVNIDRKFSNAQKVAPVRRSGIQSRKSAHKVHNCKKVHTCLEKYMEENQLNFRIQERKKAFIHVYGVNAGEVQKMIQGWREGAGYFKNITWQGNDRNLTNNMILNPKEVIKIIQGGSYFVYCNLRVGLRYLQEVSIKKNHGGKEETIFSQTLNSGNGTYDVKLSGLVSVLNGTKLYVKIKRDPYKNINSKDQRTLKLLFPDLFDEDHVKNNYFGMFLVS